MFFTQTPEAEKILWVALPIRVDLEDPRDLMLARPLVSLNTALAVSFILSGNDMNSITKLSLEALQYFETFVCGTIINTKKNKAFTPVFNFMKPFGNHLPDGGLFIVNRHDDDEFWRVHGLGLWLWQKYFQTKLTESKRIEERLPKAARRVQRVNLQNPPTCYPVGRLEANHGGHGERGVAMRF
jgi:hypothetical protein